MKLHVIAFDVPYPATYGGAIDVYYKLLWLKEQGCEVTLHAFTYGNRQPREELSLACARVYYYCRRTGLRSMFSCEPYIAYSRRSEALMKNLLADDAPILFEGLHTCHYLTDPRLRNRRKFVRMHNIEHTYYHLLAQQTNGSWWRNVYYRLESLRLRAFEPKLQVAHRVFAISEGDAQELRERYPTLDVAHMPCFYDDRFCPPSGGTRPYVLYHGNLAVEENERVANYIQDTLAPALPSLCFYIAGRAPRFEARRDNVHLVPNPSQETMDSLLVNARVNLLLTFQPTGIKLKLLHSLAKSRGYVVANAEMLAGNDLGQLCHTTTLGELPAVLTELMAHEPTTSEVKARQEELQRKKARISRLSLFE